MNHYIAEVQVMLILEIESALPSVETLAAILDSFAADADPLLGATVRIRGNCLMARTRGAVLCSGIARLEDAPEPAKQDAPVP